MPDTYWNVTLPAAFDRLTSQCEADPAIAVYREVQAAETVLDECADEEADDAYEVYSAAVDRLIAARPTTIGGVLAKVAEVRKRAEGVDTQVDALLDSLLNDALALVVPVHPAATILDDGRGEIPPLPEQWPFVLTDDEIQRLAAKRLGTDCAHERMALCLLQFSPQELADKARTMPVPVLATMLQAASTAVKEMRPTLEIIENAEARVLVATHHGLTGDPDKAKALDAALVSHDAALAAAAQEV